MSYGLIMLKRGRTNDPDCGRSSNRLMVATGILRDLGFTLEFVQHSDSCIRSPKNSHRRAFGFNYVCDDPNCPVRRNPDPVWSDGCTDEILSSAYALACAVQDARHAATCRAINSYQKG